MHELTRAVKQIRDTDRRYAPEAYFYVFEALAFAHNTMGVGSARPDSETESELNLESDVESDLGEEEEISFEETQSGRRRPSERHLSGNELCMAIRAYATEQFGYMAKCVFNSWGVTKTDDFGEIVFNLIEAGQMRKTSEDKKEDFCGVFDFDADLQDDFKITMPKDG